ncbi:hypothetical protein MP228_011595 [Amoeboaphelidium protococcarum]|nr:hypothetical protein MP228_011595 [Amoeboaphelidium protococcarum]
MKSFVLVKNCTDFERALELKDLPDLKAEKEGDVVVEVEAFGINYADILACKGLYHDCPPLPCTIGYEVVGKVKEINVSSENSSPFKVGDRVAAFCQFGGYSSQALSGVDFCIKIEEDTDAGAALALMVQYSTAWYCACRATTIAPGDHVLIQAAAGGVGTALAQIAKSRGATVYGTASNPSKLEYMRDTLNIDHPINYKDQDFVEVIKETTDGKGVDVVFDSLGGSVYSRSMKLLKKGGIMVNYGVASVTHVSQKYGGVIGGINMLFSMGFNPSILLLLYSRGVIGVNMLTIAQKRPHLMKLILKEVFDAYKNGILKPYVDKVYPSTQIVDALKHVDSRKSMGKVIVRW